MLIVLTVMVVIVLVVILHNNRSASNNSCVQVVCKPDLQSIERGVVAVLDPHLELWLMGPKIDLQSKKMELLLWNLISGSSCTQLPKP